MVSNTDSTPLPDAAEFPEPGFLVFAVGPDQFGFELVGDEGFGCGPGETFVADDDLLGTAGVFIVAKHGFGSFTFPDLRVRESSHEGHSVRGADQMQPESPKVSGVRRAVAVAGVPGKVGAFHGFA